MADSQSKRSLPLLQAAVYRAPLREGGSLPAVVEARDESLWVVKFRGAGQGPRALVAEVIVAGLARALGLATPELALMELAADFGQGERDPEIRDVLRFSTGINVAARYLDGAFNLDPVAVPEVLDPVWAASTVWLDALVTNPDRSPRNPNLMFFRGGAWLIDHGAALFDHHNWGPVTGERMRRPFVAIRDHILLPWAAPIPSVDEELARRLDEAALEEIVARVPDAFLEDPAEEAGGLNYDAQRARYVAFLSTRLRGPRSFAEEAERARKAALETPARRLDARR